jgi:exodeoxyribonuclease X
MNTQSIILDTETNTLYGLPVQIAYLPCSFEQGGFALEVNSVFDELFSVDQPIGYGAMAVHHIIEADLIGKPSYKTFQMPVDTAYVIAHNVQYDLDVLKHCDIDVSKYKPICTLALARMVFPAAPAHTVGALSYMLSADQGQTRELLKEAHNAKADILLTADILKHLVHSLGVRSMEELYQASEKARIPTHLNFGKHKGLAIGDVPASYVSWLLSQDELDPYLRKALLGQKG